MIRVNITDPPTVAALENAKKLRKMATYVEQALAHYVRTDEGREALGLLEARKGKAFKGNLGTPCKPTASPEPATAQSQKIEKEPISEAPVKALDFGGFLRVGPGK